mgnify:CR=1 FL=1
MFDPFFWQIIMNQQRQYPYFHYGPPQPPPPGFFKQAFVPNQQAGGGDQQGGGGGGGLDLLGALLGGGDMGGGGGGESAGGGGDMMGGGGGGDMMGGGGGGQAQDQAGGAQGDQGGLAPEDMALLDPMSAPPMDVGGGGTAPRSEAVAQVEAALAIFKEAVKKLEEALETLAAETGTAPGGPGMGAEEAKQAKIVRAHVVRFLRGF